MNNHYKSDKEIEEEFEAVVPFQDDPECEHGINPAHDCVNHTCLKRYKIDIFKKLKSFIIKLRHSDREAYKKEFVERVNDFCADERDKLGDFNSLNDEYKEGYWIAMNTVMKFIEKSLLNEEITKHQ